MIWIVVALTVISICFTLFFVAQKRININAKNLAEKLRLGLSQFKSMSFEEFIEATRRSSPHMFDEIESKKEEVGTLSGKRITQKYIYYDGPAYQKSNFAIIADYSQDTSLPKTLFCHGINNYHGLMVIGTNDPDDDWFSVSLSMFKLGRYAKFMYSALLKYPGFKTPYKTSRDK